MVYFVFTFSYKVVKYKHINDLEEVIFMANSTFKQYAREAKSRMLKNGNFPTFVGVIPLRKYDVLLKLVGNNDTLCKMCSIIESDGVFCCSYYSCSACRQIIIRT